MTRFIERKYRIYDFHWNLINRSRKEGKIHGRVDRHLPVILNRLLSPFRRSIVPFLIDDAHRRIFVTSFPVVIPRDVSLRQTKSACDFRYHDFRMVDHLRASAGRSLNHHKLNDINTPGKIHERLTDKSMHKWFTSHTLKIISRCFYIANDFSRPWFTFNHLCSSCADGQEENCCWKEKKFLIYDRKVWNGSRCLRGVPRLLRIEMIGFIECRFVVDGLWR